jgi:hypothetical protein
MENPDIGTDAPALWSIIRVRWFDGGTSLPGEHN